MATVDTYEVRLRVAEMIDLGMAAWLASQLTVPHALSHRPLGKCA